MKRALLIAVAAAAVATSSIAFSQGRNAEPKPARVSVDQRVAALEQKIAALELQLRMMKVRLDGAVKQGVHLTK